MSRTATRTYLEMRSPADLRPAAPPSHAVRIERVPRVPPAFWRYLYTEVGRAFHWVDRLSWTDDDIRRYFADPALQLWVMAVGVVPAGYFELRAVDDGSVEIAYFGLLPDFVGQGLGKYMLTAAAERAWGRRASRVWLHTSSLDHPSALNNYLARGFTVFKTEMYELPDSG